MVKSQTHSAKFGYLYINLLFLRKTIIVSSKLKNCRTRFTKISTFPWHVQRLQVTFSSLLNRPQSEKNWRARKTVWEEIQVDNRWPPPSSSHSFSSVRLLAPFLSNFLQFHLFVFSFKLTVPSVCLFSQICTVSSVCLFSQIITVPSVCLFCSKFYSFHLCRRFSVAFLNLFFLPTLVVQNYIWKNGFTLSEFFIL
jgi:hypothetical protein